MTQVGNVYGEALYDLAASENVSETILHQMKILNESFAQEPDYLRLLSAPGLSKEQRCDILDQSFRGKVEPYLLNFLKILAEKGYSRYFADCLVTYEALYNRDHGILAVTAVTAVALTQPQQEKLIQKLSVLTGKTISLTNRIDSGVLGGIRLDYDGKCLDDTVSRRLESVRSLLKNTVI